MEFFSFIREFAEKNSSFYFVEFSKNSATCKDKFVRLPSFSKSRQKSNSTFLKTQQKNSSFAPYGSDLRPEFKQEKGCDFLIFQNASCLLPKIVPVHRLMTNLG